MLLWSRVLEKFVSWEDKTVFEPTQARPSFSQTGQPNPFDLQHLSARYSVFQDTFISSGGIELHLRLAVSTRS